MTWIQLARSQHGTISREQLSDIGMAQRTISRLVDNQELWPIHEAVYLVRGAPLTYAARMWTAVLWSGGVLGFDTAGYLWHEIAHQPGEVHVCVDHSLRSRAPTWVRLHRVAVPDWAAAVRFGLPVTTESWTLMDLIGAARTDSAGSALLDRGVQQGWINPDHLDRRLKACSKRYGNGRLRRLREQLTDGAAAQSERLLHRLLRRGGITGWRPNHRIAVGAGEFVEADIAIPAWRLVIEVDGWAHHSDVERFRGDRRKQNALVALGWTVLRFTCADLTERPESVIAQIRNVGAQVDAG